MDDARLADWRTFIVRVDGYDPDTMSARSRSAARWQAFQRFAEPYPDLTFRDFVKVTKVTPCDPPDVDGYEYVRRNYGLDVKIGQRVELKDEGASSGLQGVVVYPGPSTAHVHVAIDGRTFVSTVHPFSIKALPELRAKITQGSESRG